VDQFKGPILVSRIPNMSSSQAPSLDRTAREGGSEALWQPEPPAAAVTDSERLTIGMVVPGWPVDAFPNGVITCVAAITDGLRQRGHRVVILAHHVAKGYHDQDVVKLDAAHAPSTGLRRVFDALAFRFAPELYRLTKARRVGEAIRQVVVERGLQILEIEEVFGWSEHIQKGCPAPVVVRLHGPMFLNGAALGLPSDAAFRNSVRVEGSAIRAADGVTSPSRDTLEQTRAYYNLPLETAEAIPNAIVPVSASERWNPSCCEPDVILFVGRFDRHKGGDVVIDAFAEVARRNPRARLRFVGPDRGLTDAMGRRWQITDYMKDRLGGLMDAGRVEWLGPRPHSALAALRRQAAVTVVSSRYETFSLTTLEAMAYGCPLVASRTGGIREIITDGVHGLLCNPDDPQDLAAKLCRLLDDTPLAEQLGRQAAAHCEQSYDPLVLADQTVDYYRRLIARSGSPKRSV
jgi:glycosyltransferase involved in cell wall biosynthesis